MNELEQRTMAIADDQRNKHLVDVLTNYAQPDPSIVAKLPRKGVLLDYVGHADVTRILIEIDPLWTWTPLGFTPEGTPAITETPDQYELWGSLTLLGLTRIGVGSCDKEVQRKDGPIPKGDISKELIGDLLRNCAMRFGIALALWSKSEWAEGPVELTDAIAKRHLLDTCGGDKDLAVAVWNDAQNVSQADLELMVAEAHARIALGATPE